MLKHQARRSFNGYKFTRHSEANKRDKHNVFLLITRWEKDWPCRRSCQVDAVGDASGCLEESVHEVLEGVLLGVRHFESCQLVFLSLLAVHSDQRQGDVSTTAGRRFLPLLHSVCDLI